MANKHLLISLTALALAGGAALFFSHPSSAYRGDPAKTGPRFDTERRQAVENAFADKDYESWKALMGDRGPAASGLINKENFARFAEMRSLLKQGKTEEADKIRAELNLPAAPGDGFGHHRGMMGKGQGFRYIK